MGQTVVDEVWLREPRLLVPQSQPLGLVNLSLSCPERQKIAEAYIATPAGMRSLTTNAITLGPVLPGPSGLAFNADATLGASYDIDNYADKATILQHFLIASSLYVDHGAHSAGSEAFGLRGRWSSGNVIFGRRSTLSTELAYTGKEICSCCSADGSAFLAYVNGGLAISGTAQTYSGAAPLRFSSSTNGGVYLVVLWLGVALPEAVLASLSADPYQIVVPAT